MQSSVDKLFEDSEMINTQSSMLAEDTSGHTPPASPRPVTSTPMVKQNKPSTPPRSASPAPSTQSNKNRDSNSANESFNNSSDLFKEYQRQRQQITKQLEEQEKQRMAYQRELQELEYKQQRISVDDNRLIDSTSSESKSFQGVLDNQRK